MSSNNEKANTLIRNSIFGIYFIASLILFYFLYTKNESQKTLSNNQLIAENEVIDSLNSIQELQLEIIEADNQYISSNYKEAKSMYQNLLLKTPEGSVNYENIALRLNRLTQIENNKDSLLSNIEDYQYSLRVSRKNEETTNAKLDSIAGVYNKINDSLSAQLELKKATITTKDRQLNKKEKIQVISFRNSKGNLIHYLGEVSSEKANGGGVGIFDTGGIYRGEWKDNQRHGEGSYEWKDGHKYEGQFKKGIREGQGTYYWSSGEKYVGEWKNGKRNGQGTLYDRDHNIQYEGTWIDDKVQQ